MATAATGGSARRTPRSAPPATAPPGGRVAAFFDLDQTVLAGSSTLAMSRPFRRHGLVGPGTAARGAYAHASYLARGADHGRMERMRAFLTELVTGWEVAVVEALVTGALDDVLLPMVYDEAAELVRWHREFGRDVVVVSSSAQEVVGPIGERLGVDLVVGTRMAVTDGRYTGEISRYVYGPEKAAVVRELARERGYDLAACYAYSDSVTDVPMLEAVGRPHAVNPDRALRARAEAAGWPVLDFARPAALARRGGVPRPAAATLAAAGVTVAATTAALGWYVARRRR